MNIPNSYISEGQNPQTFYDLGSMNMEAEILKEENKCLPVGRR